MSDTNGSTGNPSGGGRDGKRLAVYAINDKDGDRASWWQRIGLAFTNRDGSIAIYLDALPLGTNKLQVREAKDEARPAAGNGSAAAPTRRRPDGEEVRS